MEIIFILLYLFFAPESETLLFGHQSNSFRKPTLMDWKKKMNLKWPWRNKDPVMYSKDSSGGQFQITGNGNFNNGMLQLNLAVKAVSGTLPIPGATPAPGVTTVTSASSSPLPTGIPGITTIPTIGSSLATSSTAATLGPTSGTKGTGTTTSGTTMPTARGPTAIITNNASSATPTSGPSGGMSPGITTPKASPGAPAAATVAPTTVAATSAPKGATTLATLATTATSPTTSAAAATSAAAGSTNSAVKTSGMSPTTSPSGRFTLTSPPLSQPSQPSQPSVGLSPGKTCQIPVKVGLIAAIINEILKTHNAHRRTHGSAPLTLDDQMTCDAMKFAQTLAHKRTLQHQSSQVLATKGLGENIGMSCAPAVNGNLLGGKILRMARNVAKRWYDEVCQYHFDRPGLARNTGHFAEMVWSGSKKFGFGYAIGKNSRFPGYDCVYAVGRYSPSSSGNTIEVDRMKYNVKKGNFNKLYCQTPKVGQASHKILLWDKRNNTRRKPRKTKFWQKRRQRSFHHHHHLHRNLNHHQM